MNTPYKAALARPKLQYRLTGANGNAYNLMAIFRRAAVQAHWPNDEIEAVLQTAMQSDYDHLLTTLCLFTESP